VDAAFKLITGKLPELESSAPPPRSPSNWGSDVLAYSQEIMKYHRSVVNYLTEINEKIDGLTRAETNALVGRLTDDQLKRLALIASHLEGMRNDCKVFEWTKYDSYLAEDRAILLEHPLPALFSVTFAKQVDSGKQMARLINAYVNASQDRGLQDSRQAQALTVSAVSYTQAKYGYPALGTPHYLEHIRAMEHTFLKNAELNLENAEFKQTLALSDELGPQVQEGVSFPPILIKPDENAPATDSSNVKVRRDFGDPRGAIVADLIGLLKDKPVALLHVFQKIPDAQLQQVASNAVLGFRMSQAESTTSLPVEDSDLEIEVDADTTSLVSLINATNRTDLIGLRGSFEERCWLVYGRTFTVVTGAIDKFVKNGFYSTNPLARNHLIPANNRRVREITDAMIEVMNNNAQRLVSGLRHEGGRPHGNAWLPTGNPMIPFIVYLKDDDTVEKEFAVKPDSADPVPLIGHDGRLETFWKRLWGNQSGVLRAEFFWSGQPQGYPGWDSTGIVRGNIAFFTGNMKAADDAFNYMLNQEMSTLQYSDSILNTFLSLISFGGKGFVAKWMVSPVTKFFLGRDNPNNAVSIRQFVDYADGQLRNRKYAMEHLALPNLDDMEKTRTHNVSFPALTREASAGGSAFYRANGGSSSNPDQLDAFLKQMTAGSRGGETFYNLTYEPRTRTFKSAESGFIRWFNGIKDWWSRQ
jgi:hypothetical protein